ncbi:MAG: DUF6666 family protein [Planctomycetia bacterium]|nr:DUF6666 family protein [Planctomycetia bacterium]
MCGKRTSPARIAVALFLGCALSGAAAPAVAQQSSRSIYAKQGQFAARTTNYSPAWRVHPKVRQPGPVARTAQQGGVRQARHQQEVLEPPFADDESGVPSFEDSAPAEEIPAAQPTLSPRATAQEPVYEVAPSYETAPQTVAPRAAPRNNGRRSPTLAPPRMENEIAPGAGRYEQLPAPRGVQRVQPDFDYEITEQYGPEEYVEEGEYYDDGMSSCPDCGQVGNYCECGPPNVCDDSWPCWHARQQWRNFRLFGGGWDIGCPWNWWDELSLSFGPHSFKGPLDQGQNGNFGFQEAVNWGGPLSHCRGIGFQLGAQGVQSNFAGDAVNGGSDDNRNQVFATAAIFARAPNNHGWQIGVAFDWLEDDYYVDVSLNQVRAELGYVTFCGSEVGAWITSSSDSTEDVDTGILYEATDMYAFYFRQCMPSGGEGRIWGGGTGDGNGLVGADFRVPLTNRWSLNGAVNYVIPQDGTGQDGLNQEAFGMTMNLVWYPFRPRTGPPCNNGPYRPLFNVADNNMFMVDRVMAGE